ncbi:MAG: FAD-dependent oxidoreductase [Desulfosarcina sp.]|nr:FAD-dependent oxidoreductase [Desulfobacterales bacterium]
MTQNSMRMSGSREKLDRRLHEVMQDIHDKCAQYGKENGNINYRKGFIGSEAVAQLVVAGIAAEEEDAVRIGNLLLNAGVFHHVQQAHIFKNEHLFYRFVSDEDHGTIGTVPDGSAVSWTDFIAPLVPTKDKASLETLQPAIPGQDPDLAAMAQDDLDTRGLAPLDKYNARLLDNVHPKKWVNPTPQTSYNLVVIGAGAGGLVSSSGVGARVALIESHLLGGDCLNVGCVPSKALLRCARAAAAVRQAPAFGINIEGEVTVDFGQVMERLRRLRAQISPVDSARRYSAQLGVDVFLGKGVFTGRNTIEANGRTLHFAKAVVATGGTAAIPNIPGLKEAPYLTNASVFNLTERPARLGIIGAGPIGLELAQAFQRLGSQVTVFSRSDKILPKEDPAAAAIVKTALQRDGVTFPFHARYKRVERGDGPNGVTVVLEEDGGERALAFDALLVAAGRKPSVSGLGLETAGVEFNDVDRSILEGTTEGFVKMHVKKGTDQILGATIVGSHAGDMISEITVAMQSGMGLGKLANVIHPYPTSAEAIRQCGDAYNRDRLTPTVKSIFYKLMALKR